MQADGDLVRAVLGGETAAYADLVQRYERAVQAAAVEVLHDLHAAQDVAQEAFVTAYQQLGRLREPEVFGGWVLRIARHTALRLARRQRARTVSTPPEDLPAPSRNGQLDEQQERLLEAVVRLPEHERVVVMLRYFDGQVVEAIAEVTGRPVGTVTKQLSRAHARLREWLKDVES